MAGGQLFQLKSPASGRALLAWLSAGVALTGLMQYFWLYADTALHFRIWGFQFLPAFLAPLPFLIFLFRSDIKSFTGIRMLLGSPGRWLAALFFPLLAFGGVVAYHASTGGEVDPSWKWLTLALGALLDLPLVTLWIIPMMLVQELFWRSSVEQALTGSVYVKALVSSLFWVAANAVLLINLAEGEKPLFIGALAGSRFASGWFAYKLQRNGALLLSTFALVLSASAWLLLFGGNIPEINRILFGYDVTEFEGLFPPSERNRDLLAMIATAGFLLVASFPLGRRKQ